MAYKTLLVHVETGPESDRRLAMAVDLATLWSATLIGVGGCVPVQVADAAFGDLDGTVLEVLEIDEQHELAASQARFQAAVAHLDGASIWRSGRDYPDRVLEGCSAGADLILSGAAHGAPGRTVDPAVLALRCGLPILTLPPSPAEWRFEKIVIAWKNTREARRAVSDALPLLQAAREVAVVEVRARDAEADPWDGAAGIVDRLARHGVAATRRRVERGFDDVAADLIADAEDHEADLIVSGAYGYSRLREWAFGGVTRGLLARSAVPVFCSH